MIFELFWKRKSEKLMHPFEGYHLLHVFFILHMNQLNATEGYYGGVDL